MVTIAFVNVVKEIPVQPSSKANFLSIHVGISNVAISALLNILHADWTQLQAFCKDNAPLSLTVQLIIINSIDSTPS